MAIGAEIPEIEIKYPESLKGEMCRNVFLISKVFQNYVLERCNLVPGVRPTVYSLFQRLKG